MDRMYRMRDAHKAARIKAEDVNPITGEEMDIEHEKSLEQIFRDPEKQDRFLNYLYSQDDALAKEIAEVLKDGTIFTPAQNVFLEKSRKQFNQRLGEIDAMRESIDDEEIIRIAHTDKRIEEVVGKIGAEKAAELFNKELSELAFKDEKTFKKIIEQLRSVHQLRTSEEARQLSNRVEVELQRFGVSEESYWSATEAGKGIVTQAQLNLLAAENLQGWKKAFDFIGGFSRRRGATLYKSFEDQTKLLEECDKHLRVVGRVMRGTLNKEVQEAIQKLMLEGGQLETDSRNVKTIGDYKMLSADQEKGPRKARFEEYLARRAPGIRPRPSEHRGRWDPIAHLNTGEKVRIKDEFAREEAGRNTKYKASGVLMALISVLFPNQAAIRSEVDPYLP